jgi:hypothetical protein
MFGPRIFRTIPLIILLSGCATVYLDTASLRVPVAMTDSINKPYTVLKHFKHERKGYFILLGFIKIANPDFHDILNAEINEVHGDAIVNTSMEAEYDLVDTIVPYGIGAAGWAAFGPVGLNLSYAFTMQTYRIQGDIVKYSK